MTGRERVLAALRCEEVDRVPWVPYVGAHGGALIGAPASSSLTSVDLALQGLQAAQAWYEPDGLPILFDLQVEAEVLGCDLAWAEDGPPAVTSHPLAGDEDWSPAQVPDLDMEAGRIPMAMEVTRRAREAFGDSLALYGLICGPFTLALHLLGNDIFLEMYDEPGKVADLLMRCAGIGRRMAEAYLEAGCDVVAVVDPMVSQISPEHFVEFVTPAMDALFDDIRRAGGVGCCFVCGDVTRNLDVMLDLHCEGISVDEQIDMAALLPKALAKGKSVGGNLKLTTVLLLGSEADAKLHAIEVLDACGTRGFLLSPGCDLPYAVPPANVAAAGLMARDAYQREVARTTCTATTADSFDDITLPDYAAAPKVILDVITLDSRTCAPCTYMMEAANRALAAHPDTVDVREHRITSRDGIGHLVRLRARNLPTICVDGVPTFESLIPTDAQLADAIAAAHGRKG